MVVSNSLPIKFCMTLKILMVTCCGFSTSELSIDVENHGGIIIIHFPSTIPMPSVWGHLQIWVQTLHSSWNWARSKTGRGLSEISRTYGTVRLVFSLLRYGWYMCFPHFLCLNHVKSRKMPAKKYPVSIYACRYSSIKYLNML